MKGLRRACAAIAVMVGGCSLVAGIDGDYHTECTPGAMQCAVNAPQVCVDELWQYQAECAGQTCVAGACQGQCAPSDMQCAWNRPQGCDGTGQWMNLESCPLTETFCSAGFCSGPPSCAGLGWTCGPNHDESCCATTTVPGGTYNRSNDPQFPATISDFRLDRFEITVGRFRAFVAAFNGSKPAPGTGAHPLIEGSGWNPQWDDYVPQDQWALMQALHCDSSYQTWTDEPGANEDLPINCIDWHMAFLFCAWDGGRLPTEAEWNYAAAAGSEHREYPWSQPPSSMTLDSSFASYDCVGDGSGSQVCAFSDIQTVGSKSPVGDGKWGQADLGGSMSEWNLDWEEPYQLPCVNCAILQGGTNRTLRGGDWGSSSSGPLSSDRSASDPSDRNPGIGARCARDF